MRKANRRARVECEHCAVLVQVRNNGEHFKHNCTRPVKCCKCESEMPWKDAFMTKGLVFCGACIHSV